MKKIIFIIFLISVFFSCSKLEEGPAFSFKTKRERINNTWVVNKFISSGVDSTDYFKTHSFNQIYFGKINIFDVPSTYQAKINDSITFEGNYNINSYEGKTVLNFLDGSSYAYPIMYPIHNVGGLLIVRLTNDELIISLDKRNYRFEFAALKEE